LSPEPVRASVKKKSDFVGPGAAVQLLGIVLPIALGFMAGPAGAVVGILAGIMLLIIGGRMAILWTCGKCGNKLTSKQVKICPTCGAENVWQRRRSRIGVSTP